MNRRIMRLVSWTVASVICLAGCLLATQDNPLDTDDTAPPAVGASGEHFRLETPFGPIHLWRPEDYDPRTAGTVIYVHGYFTGADEAWEADRLAAQFEASHQNALFIVPEAPASKYEEVPWKSLESLLRTVDEVGPFPVPTGPVAAVGHSGAFRTILGWLPNPRLHEVILLDGLYNGQRDFSAWLRSSPGTRSHRMILVASATRRKSDRFARRQPGVARRPSVPVEFSQLTPRERHASLIYLRSQYTHSEMISSGRVIPVLLKFAAATALPESPVRTAAVRRKSATAGTKKASLSSQRAHANSSQKASL